GVHFRLGPDYFWAQEIAGNWPPDRESPRRVQARQQRVQVATRGGNAADRGRSDPRTAGEGSSRNDADRRGGSETAEACRGRDLSHHFWSGISSQEQWLRGWFRVG